MTFGHLSYQIFCVGLVFESCVDRTYIVGYIFIRIGEWLIVLTQREGSYNSRNEWEDLSR